MSFNNFKWIGRLYRIRWIRLACRRSSFTNAIFNNNVIKFRLFIERLRFIAGRFSEWTNTQFGCLPFFIIIMDAAQRSHQDPFAAIELQICAVKRSMEFSSEFGLCCQNATYLENEVVDSMRPNRIQNCCGLFENETVDHSASYNILCNWLCMFHCSTCIGRSLVDSKNILTFVGWDCKIENVVRTLSFVSENISDTNWADGDEEWATDAQLSWNYILLN